MATTHGGVQAGVTAQILCATGQDQYRKPESGMFDYFVEHGNGGQKPGQSDIHGTFA